MDEIKKTFGTFDKDNSDEIDKEEAITHWKSKFGKLSAKEFFNQVDANKDGTISIREFQSFFEIVKRSGHSEEEIREALV